jgi:integrase
VSATTAKAYKRDYEKFESWLIEHYRVPPTKDQMDGVVSIYVNQRFETLPTRGSRQHCVNVRAALMLKYPPLRHCLYTSARELKGWDKAVPEQARSPMPYMHALLFAAIACHQRKPQVAVWILLSHHTYLRVGEPGQLTISDVEFPNKDRDEPGVISIQKTKAQTPQSVTFTDALVVGLLKWLVGSRTQPHQRELPLFATTQLQLSSALHELCEVTQTKPHFTAHSMRHGGASHDYMRNMPMQDIITRGRWKSKDTAEHYIQASRALMIARRIPTHWVSMAEQLRKNPLLLLTLL